MANIVLLGPDAWATNYKIVPTVTSNNLTVSLKTAAGTDPTTANPVMVRIGDTERLITSALSVTKNAGTNWCNSGGAELATLEVDYFVYLGYNATDGVTIGFSRIPHATLYSEFSATSTNEKYCAISTITNAAAGDNYVNIGRFAATLSAGAGYTWTVPSYTSTNLVQRPIYETRDLLFTPVWTNLTVGDGTVTASYKLMTNVLRVATSIVFGATSSISGSVSHTIPFTRSTSFYRSIGLVPSALARFRDSSASTAYFGTAVTSGDASFLGSLDSSVAYLTNAALSSTVPFTWATSDTIEYEISCVI